MYKKIYESVSSTIAMEFILAVEDSEWPLISYITFILHSIRDNEYLLVKKLKTCSIFHTKEKQKKWAPFISCVTLASLSSIHLTCNKEVIAPSKI